MTPRYAHTARGRVYHVIRHRFHVTEREHWGITNCLTVWHEWAGWHETTHPPPNRRLCKRCEKARRG